MKRFVNLGEQICPGAPCFAWFDTVVSQFEEHNGAQIWDSWGEFKADYVGGDLKRYLGLFMRSDFGGIVGAHDTTILTDE